MAHLRDNVALRLPVGDTRRPAKPHIYTAFEQSEDELRLSKLNALLASQSGQEYRLEFYYGDQVGYIDEDTLVSVAECYRDVFNESWEENWTTHSALAEIRSCLQPDPDRIPIVSLLFRQDRVIGFCWAFAMDCDTLDIVNAPFTSSQLKRHETVEVTQYWMREVSTKKRFISIRELGVIKEYRQDKAPFLCLPVFDKAQDVKCDVVFFRTKVSSKAFKWSLGVGFVPLQFFMQDGLLLMQGSIKYAINLLNGLLGGQKRKSQHMIISNINRYLCL